MKKWFLLFCGFPSLTLLAQNVGIGVLAPQSRLDIHGQGNSANTSSLNVSNNQSNSALFVNDLLQVGIQNTNPNPSAVLDIQSTQAGVLIPRMTNAQMQAIVSPATGLLIFNSDNQQFRYWNGSAWVGLISSVTGNQGSAGAMNLLYTDETTNTSINVSYSPCGTGNSSGNTHTYALPANSYSRILAEAEGYFEIGANGGNFNSASVTMTLPGGNSRSTQAKRSVTGGGTGDTSWHFPFKVSVSGPSQAGGNVVLSGSLSLGGCTGGRIVVSSFRVYGVQ
ncbi:MAG: hypothetical protein FJZ75_05980 [Bacteroidetes bacterium]|nr:hypothetical protein [Bacteroidota bacterium]